MLFRGRVVNVAKMPYAPQTDSRLPSVEIKIRAGTVLFVPSIHRVLSIFSSLGRFRPSHDQNQVEVRRRGTPVHF